MEFENKTFENETVTLDDNVYRNCTFRNVVFSYAGRGVDMSECRIESFSFVFDGDLSRGLFTLYQLFGTEGMLTIIRGMAEPPTEVTVLEGRPSSDPSA